MLAVIGGSGLYNLEGFKIEREVFFETPFGLPSAPVVIGKVGDRRVAFLARHGRDHSYPPHRVPYRANLWILYKLGFKRILGVFAVGSINRNYKPGDFVVVEDFINFTSGREDTYYEGKFSHFPEGEGEVEDLLRSKRAVHVDFSEPYCPQIRGALVEILENKGFAYHTGAVYACTQGPRFETKAEIRMLDKLGSDVVGMTGYPEVALARELTLCYGALCVVANPAAGIASYPLTSDEVIEMMKEKEENIKEIILDLVKKLPEERSCPCPNALKGAQV